MNLYEGFARIEETIVPILNDALMHVRAKKEEIMSEKWGCPMPGCEKTGKSKRAINIHLTVQHKLPMGSPGRPDPVRLPDEGEVPAPVESAPAVVESSVVAPPVVAPLVDAENSEPEVESMPVVPRAEVPASDPSPSAPEPPAVVPDFPPPVVQPVQPTSVPLGSAVLLDGPTWWQHPGTGAWESSVAAKLPVQVVHKEVSSAGDVMLICRAEGGTALWSIQEQQILSGAIKILQAAPVSPTLESEATRPADGPRDIQKPDYDYFEAQRQEQEKRQAQEGERQDYGSRLGRYTDANRRKLNTTKEFNLVKQEEQEKLIAYVRKYGEPSVPGKEDMQVTDFNHQARVTTIQGETGIRRKTEIIVQWLIDNDLHDCLTDSLNIPAWEKAKADGRVPADFVREVEEPYKNDSSSQFRVDPV